MIIGRGRCEQGRKCIVVALGLIPEFCQQLFEQHGEFFFRLAACQHAHEFVLHQPDHHQRQEPVDHDPAGVGLIENKPLFSQEGGQLRDFFL